MKIVDIYGKAFNTRGIHDGCYAPVITRGSKKQVPLELSNHVLSNVHVENVTLQGWNFLETTFYNVVFTDSTLDYCHFNKANFISISFINCLIRHCVMPSVVDGNAYFEKCMVRETFFRDSVYERLAFNECYLNANVLTNMTIKSGSIYYSRIRNCMFNDTDLTHFNIDATLVAGCNQIRLLGVRSDSYCFYLMLPSGMIRAGCRYYTLEQAYKHWSDPDYPNGELLRQESLMFLDNATKLINFQY